MRNTSELVNSIVGNDSSSLIFSILVVSRSFHNISELLFTIAGSMGIDLKAIEVLCSWNGTQSDEKKIFVPPGLQFNIVNRQPYHFASNINKLSSLAKAEYVCVVNDDVKLKPSTLLNSLKYLARSEVGLVGAILLYPNKKIQHCGIGFKEDMSPFHIEKGVDADISNCMHSPRVVEACTGALFFCQKKIFTSIKMRENFIECGEDVCFSIDLAAKTGLSIVVPNDVIAEHKEGDTRTKLGKQGTPTCDLEFIKNHAAKYKRKKISVSIRTEEKGWIFYRKAEEIKNNTLNCEVKINGSDNEADIVYFIHYARYNKNVGRGKITIANFTHYVPGTNTESLFKKVAHEVDYCIAISESTRRSLLEIGISDERIKVIEVGAAKEFKPKVVIGLVGRVYNDGRKGEDMVLKLSSDKEVRKYIELVSMNDCWGVKTLNVESHHLFYSLIDYLLIPSRVEGGPVPFMEALACGKLSVAPPIGVVPSFPHIQFQTGNYESMKSKIIETAKRKIVELKNISSCIAHKTWESWAFEHQLVFQNLLKNETQKDFVKISQSKGSYLPQNLLPLACANKLFRDGRIEEALVGYKYLMVDERYPEKIILPNLKLAEKKLISGK